MEYVSRVELLVNGQLITDFKAVEEKAVPRNAQVMLMGKTGHRKRTPRYGVTVDYVVPDDHAAFDWASVRGSDATLSIVYEGGTRIKYSGVHVLEEGTRRYDEDNDCVQTIDIGAEKRDPA